MKRNLLKIVLTMLLTIGLIPNMIFVHAEDENVAKVGDKEYATLQGAIDEVGENESTIILIGDVFECVKIGKNQNIILDLNGHKISNASTDRTDTITNAGTLTIKGDGQVDSTVAWIAIKASALRNEDGATAILSGGTYTRSKENSINNSYYVLLNRGNMLINSGVTVRNVDGDYSSLIENGYFSANENKNGTYAKLTINDGNFIGGRYNVKNDDYGILEINGGNFSINQNWNILNYNELTINGGNFVNTFGYNIYAGMDKAVEYEDGELKITGGKFKTEYPTTWCMQVGTDLDLIEITGGTYDNSMKEDDWHIADNAKMDVDCIPDTHTKVAVGTVDKEKYIFKVVPVSLDNDFGSVNVAVNKEISLNTLDKANVSDLRIYEIVDTDYNENADPANDVDMRTAIEKEEFNIVSNECANIKFNADDLKLVINGKKAGTVKYIISYTDSTNPNKYVTGVLTVNVKNPVTVIFTDMNNNEIEKQVIDYGSDAVAPTAPVENGYNFTKWNKEYTNVTEDIIVKALYEKVPEKPETPVQPGDDVDPIPNVPVTPVTPTEPDDDLNSDVLGDKVENDDKKKPNVNIDKEDNSIDSDVLGDKVNNQSKNKTETKKVKTSDNQEVMIYMITGIVALVGVSVLVKRKKYN